MIKRFTKDEIESVWEEPLAGNIQSIYGKVNKLIDAVNELTSCVGQLGVEFTDPAHPENVQPDTESRPENVQDEMPRCPFCGEELSYAQEIDGGFDILTCDCPRGFWLFGNDKMWYNLEKVNKMAQKLNFAQPEVKGNVAENRECSKTEQSPFVEQRKWIGKLCWYKLCEGDIWKVGRLEKIQENADAGYPFVFDGLCYKICEPVKPDDYIIYKGGDNE